MLIEFNVSTKHSFKGEFTLTVEVNIYLESRALYSW